MEHDPKKSDAVPAEPLSGRRLDSEELKQLQAVANSPLARRPLIGVLENIRSMGNVGSMFRTADATLLERLVLCGYTAHPPREDIEKTALGACETVPWEYWGHATQAIDWLRAQGYRVLALERTTTSVPLDQVTLEGPTAFVVGNEVAGVSDAVLDVCDGAVEIAMGGAKESLNVAVAFGVCAYGLASLLPPQTELRNGVPSSFPVISSEGHPPTT